MCVVSQRGCYEAGKSRPDGHNATHASRERECDRPDASHATHLCMLAARNMLTYKARGLVCGRTWVGNGRRGRCVRSAIIYSREMSVYSREISRVARFTRAIRCCQVLPGTECQMKSGVLVPSSREAREVAVIRRHSSGSNGRARDPRTAANGRLGILQHAVSCAEQQCKCAPARCKCCGERGARRGDVGAGRGSLRRGQAAPRAGGPVCPEGRGSALRREDAHGNCHVEPFLRPDVVEVVARITHVACRVGESRGSLDLRTSFSL